MTGEQYITILSALGDIQTAVDAIGLDIEAMMEDLEIETDDDPASRADGGEDLIVVPEWVNRRCQAPVDTGKGERSPFPPPERGNPGAVAGVVVIAIISAFVAVATYLLMTL